MKTIGYMGIDQYGKTYHIGNNHPRKWLLNHLYRKHCSKMYCDTTNGKIKHIGYVIAGLWINIYRVEEWKAAV